jgi:dTMP kinase
VFIAIEGIAGSGKSTQARMLVQWLRKQGRKALKTREPTQSETGELLRGILKKHTEIDPKALTFLFLADRIEHANQIKAELDEGKIVVCDRYMLSTLAYQSAQGLDLEWLKGLHQGILQPELTFLLDIDPELSMQRLRSEDKFEKIPKHLCDTDRRNKDADPSGDAGRAAGKTRISQRLMLKFSFTVLSTR